MKVENLEDDETKNEIESLKVDSQQLLKMNTQSDVRSMPKDVEELLSPTMVLKNDHDLSKSVNSLLDVNDVEFGVKNNLDLEKKNC